VSREFLDPVLERAWELQLVNRPVFRWHITAVLICSVVAAIGELLHSVRSLHDWMRLGVRSGPMVLLAYPLLVFGRCRSPFVCFSSVLPLRCCVMN
jgi:hypothetical protein